MLSTTVCGGLAPIPCHVVLCYESATQPGKLCEPSRTPPPDSGGSTPDVGRGRDRDLTSALVGCRGPRGRLDLLTSSSAAWAARRLRRPGERRGLRPRFRPAAATAAPRAARHLTPSRPPPPAARRHRHQAGEGTTVENPREAGYECRRQANAGEVLDPLCACACTGSTDDDRRGQLWT